MVYFILKLMFFIMYYLIIVEKLLEIREIDVICINILDNFIWYDKV